MRNFSVAPFRASLVLWCVGTRHETQLIKALRICEYEYYLGISWHNFVQSYYLQTYSTLPFFALISLAWDVLILRKFGAANYDFLSEEQFCPFSLWRRTMVYKGFLRYITPCSVVFCPLGSIGRFFWFCWALPTMVQIWSEQVNNYLLTFRSQLVVAKGVLKCQQIPQTNWLILRLWVIRAT